MQIRTQGNINEGPVRLYAGEQPHWASVFSCVSLTRSGLASATASAITPPKDSPSRYTGLSGGHCITMISKYSLYGNKCPLVHVRRGARASNGKPWSNTADTVFSMAERSLGSGCYIMLSRWQLRRHESLMLAEVLLIQLASEHPPNIPACRHGMQAHASCSVIWTKVSLCIWPMLSVCRSGALCVLGRMRRAVLLDLLCQLDQSLEGRPVLRGDAERVEVEGVCQVWELPRSCQARAVNARKVHHEG